MKKTVACRISFKDFFKIKDFTKEYRTTISEIFRRGIYREMERLKNLSKEERIAEINDNVEWNHSKHLMKESK